MAGQNTRRCRASTAAACGRVWSGSQTFHGRNLYLFVMEEIIDAARRLGVDPRHFGKVRDRRTLDGLERAEVVQQRAPARGSDARDFLEAGFTQVAPAALAMRSDGKAMRLVAQPLDEIQHGIARRQLEGCPAVHVEGFVAGVALRSLGDGDARNVEAERGQCFARSGQLPLTAVD